MFEDITSLNKVCAKDVNDKRQQLGKGAFGSVYKVKLNSVSISLIRNIRNMRTYLNRILTNMLL